MTDLFQHSFYFFDVVPDFLYTIYNFFHAYLTDSKSFLELQLINFKNHTKEKRVRWQETWANVPIFK